MVQIIAYNATMKAHKYKYLVTRVRLGIPHYYYAFPDRTQKYLGKDRRRALAQWKALTANRRPIEAPAAFNWGAIYVGYKGPPRTGYPNAFTIGFGSSK